MVQQVFKKQYENKCKIFFLVCFWKLHLKFLFPFVFIVPFHFLIFTFDSFSFLFVCWILLGSSPNEMLFFMMNACEIRHQFDGTIWTRAKKIIILSFLGAFSRTFTLDTRKSRLIWRFTSIVKLLQKKTSVSGCSFPKFGLHFKETICFRIVLQINRISKFSGFFLKRVERRNRTNNSWIWSRTMLGTHRPILTFFCYPNKKQAKQANTSWFL